MAHECVMFTTAIFYTVNYYVLFVIFSFMFSFTMLHCIHGKIVLGQDFLRNYSVQFEEEHTDIYIQYKEAYAYF